MDELLRLLHLQMTIETLTSFPYWSFFLLQHIRLTPFVFWEIFERIESVWFTSFYPGHYPRAHCGPVTVVGNNCNLFLKHGFHDNWYNSTTVIAIERTHIANMNRKKIVFSIALETQHTTPFYTIHYDLLS